VINLHIFHKTPPGNKQALDTRSHRLYEKRAKLYNFSKYKAASPDYQNQTEYKHHDTRHYFTS